jgi:ABC-type transport system involved in cytochrome c biogenesis permease subunit
VFLVPVGILLMIYAAFMPKTVEPELSIFKGMLLQVHILTTLLGYAAWAVTFAASICYLYLEKKEDKNPGLFDQMAYRAAFFAFAFLTLGIITGALWGDRVFGQLWFWDPKETWSFITWLIFMAYLHARYTLEWRPGDCRVCGAGVYVCRCGLSAAADSWDVSRCSQQIEVLASD